MLQNKFFRTTLGIIFILLILYLGEKVSVLFSPVGRIVNLLLVPFMFAGFFYYLLRPLVNYLERRKLKRPLAILLIYLVFLALFAIFWVAVWPTLQEQIQNFINNAPFIVQDIQFQFNKLSDNPVIGRYLGGESDLTARLYQYLQNAVTWVTNSMSNLITVISNIVVVIATLPILLYYMLKDSHKLPRILLGLVPRKYRKEGQEMLADIDSALSSFITTRVLLNVILGALLYIGFLIIGLPYALLLALVSIPLNFIPYIGAILSAIPILAVGFIESPMTALWSLIIIVVAQQIQDNLLTPIITGKTLDIHPMTTVILVLVGGEFYGIIGVLIALPVYMTIKIIFLKVYEIAIVGKMDEY
ncbi:permease [Paenibacillus stellifer]|uniref:Permease n=1 Tax=Paenibacillus stellifer TaxID=169760 RepID=A0A089LXG3_9BACL|nr:AI-2E family transporter [Paenibacillus stellifer]AIQ64820.1 permease [Paenibacillus stellifer]